MLIILDRDGLGGALELRLQHSGPFFFGWHGIDDDRMLGLIELEHVRGIEQAQRMSVTAQPVDSDP
jgi:hypothetical protein